MSVKPLPAECLKAMYTARATLENVEDVSTAAMLGMFTNAQILNAGPMTYVCTAFIAGVSGVSFDDDQWDEFFALCKAWAKWRNENPHIKPN